MAAAIKQRSRPVLRSCRGDQAEGHDREVSSRSYGNDEITPGRFFVETDLGKTSWKKEL
jgi:hypothetical protein